MKKNAFPFIASGIGLVLVLVLARFGAVGGNNETVLPELTQLFISEFGFLLTLGGAWFGGRVWFAQREPLGLLLVALGCLLLSLAFLYMGLTLWSSVSPA